MALNDLSNFHTSPVKACSVASLTSVAGMTRYVTATILVKQLGAASLKLSYL